MLVSVLACTHAHMILKLLSFDLEQKQANQVSGVLTGSANTQRLLIGSANTQRVLIGSANTQRV